MSAVLDALQSFVLCGGCVIPSALSFAISEVCCSCGGAVTHLPNVVLLHDFEGSAPICHKLRVFLRFGNQMVMNQQWGLHLGSQKDVCI